MERGEKSIHPNDMPKRPLELVDRLLHDLVRDLHQRPATGHGMTQVDQARHAPPSFSMHNGYVSGQGGTHAQHENAAASMSRLIVR